MKHKFISAWKLLRSKMYILITNKETIIHADMQGYDSVFILASLKAAETQLSRAIKQLTKVTKKGKPNVRKQGRRQINRKHQ